MNYLQKAIYKVILSILQVDEIEVYCKDSAIRYGLLNYIAKYSLANDTYFVTEKSYEYLKINNFIKDNKLRRGLKSKKNKFTYEHPIPSNLIANYLLENRGYPEKICKVLDWTNKVTVLTEKENSLLSGSLVSAMPDHWNFFEKSQFARYYKAGIISQEPTNKVNVYGAIAR